MDTAKVPIFRICIVNGGEKGETPIWGIESPFRKTGRHPADQSANMISTFFNTFKAKKQTRLIGHPRHVSLKTHRSPRVDKRIFWD